MAQFFGCWQGTRRAYTLCGLQPTSNAASNQKDKPDSATYFWTAPKGRFGAKAGFSLLEMMIALFLASVLILLLVSFVQTATNTVVSGEDRLYATNDIQTAMDLITADLQSVKQVQGPVSLVGTPSSVEVLQGFGGATGGGTSNPGVSINQNSVTTVINPMDLYMLTTPPSTTDASGTVDQGTPHLIRYKVVWQDPIPGSASNPNPVLALYRDHVSSSDTYGAGFDSYNNTNPGGLAGLTDLYANYWSKVPPPGASDMLISNVIDFQIMLYDVGSATPNVPLNKQAVAPSQIYFATSTTCGATFHLSSQGLAIGDVLQSSTGGVPPTPYTNLVAEIRITVLTGEGATIFNTGSLPLDNVNMAAKYGCVYIRRVPLSL